MLKEITIKDALERYMKGEDVKVLIPSPDAPENWEEYAPALLGDMLKGMYYFTEEVKLPEPETEDDIVFADEPPIETDDTDPDVKPVHEAETEPEKTPKKRGSKPKGSVDYGKMRTLYETGKWKVPEIADEMGLSEHFVYKALREMGVDLTK